MGKAMRNIKAHVKEPRSIDGLDLAYLHWVSLWAINESKKHILSSILQFSGTSTLANLYREPTTFFCTYGIGWW